MTRVMISKLVVILILAASCGIIGRSAVARRTFAGYDTPLENHAVDDVLSKSPFWAGLKDDQSQLGLDAEKGKKMVDLVLCYNGAFTIVTENCNKRSGCNITEEPLFKLCDKNRNIILDSYSFNLGKLTGASMFIPVKFLNDFESTVKKYHLEDASMEEKLKWHAGTWIRPDGTELIHSYYCKRMVDQMDEFARWGWDDERMVIDYFRWKTLLRVGEALELCRAMLAL